MTYEAPRILATYTEVQLLNSENEVFAETMHFSQTTWGQIL